MNRKNFKQLSIGIVFAIIGVVGLVLLNMGCGASMKVSAQGNGALVKDASYTVSVNYRVPVMELKRQAGYASIVVDDNPSPMVERQIICTPGRSTAWGEQTIRFRLVKIIGDPIALNEAAIAVDGLLNWGELATVEELLAFGQQYPEAQKQCRIIAVGTDCRLGMSDTYSYAPYISHRRTSLFGETEPVLGVTRTDTLAGAGNCLLVKER